MCSPTQFLAALPLYFLPSRASGASFPTVMNLFLDVHYTRVVRVSGTHSCELGEKSQLCREEIHKRARGLQEGWQNSAGICSC